MGLWDDKCKKCFKNTWECKCNQIVEEPQTTIQTMETIKEQVTNDIKKQEIIDIPPMIKQDVKEYLTRSRIELDDITLLNGDSNEKLKELPDECIDLVASDPPYGYSLMGLDWDKAIPSVELWKECLRVLKPGGFAFIMSAPRQDVLARMMINLENAGFETAFTSMYWAYASGFPKGANISKLIDKKMGNEREVVGVHENYKDFSDEQYTKQGSMMQTHIAAGPRIDVPITKSKSELGQKFEGSFAGFQPKPSVEVIIVCMKPLKEKNYIEQAMANGKGITWLNDCRVPYIDDKDIGDPDRGKGYPMLDPKKGWNDNKIVNNITIGEHGRYPANLLVSDDALNTGIDSKSDGKIRTRTRGEGSEVFTNENCGLNKPQSFKGYGDSGSFSRFFDVDRWWSQFIITPKPSKAEKNKGLDENPINNTDKYDGKFPDSKADKTNKNKHPTVKPVKLFSYLITLGSREGDRVLDPFLGSGTCGIASKMLNRKFVGIELDKDYFEICQKRINVQERIK